MQTFLMLHGVNHNMFGKRDPKQYGTVTLAQIDAQIAALAKELGVGVVSYQTNSEADMCERIHKGFLDNVDGVLLNAGAWTHYSYAIRDAVELFDVPVVEVHLSNIDQREEWRRKSVISDLTAKRVIGKGPDGYREALTYLARNE